MTNSKYNLFALILVIFFFVITKNNNIVYNNIIPGIYSPVKVSKSGYTMGTTYALQIIESSICRKYDIKKTDTIFHCVHKDLYNVNNSMSTYRNNSSISLTNKKQVENYFFYKNNFQFVFSRTNNRKVVDTQSFNNNINFFINIWGFSKKYREDKIPKIKDICNYNKQNVFYNSYEHRKYILRKIFYSIEHTMSASAKGYGVDVIYKNLRFTGYTNLLVEIGGEIRSSGLNYRNKAWTLGLLEPRIHNLFSQSINILKISNSSLASSGSYLNNIVFEEEKFSHILNINTGISIKSILLNVSVFSSSCISADIIGTLLLINNINNTVRFLSRSNVKLMLIYRNFYSKNSYITYNML